MNRILLLQQTPVTPAFIVSSTSPRSYYALENVSRKLRCGHHCFISVPFCGVSCHMGVSLSESETQSTVATQGLAEYSITTRQNDTDGGWSAPLFQRLQHKCSNITPPFPLNPHPSRNQTADESQESPSHAPLSSPQPPPSTHKNSITIPDQDQDTASPAEPQSCKTDQPSSVAVIPKLARSGPRVFDKVRAFEERRASVDPPGGVGSGPGRAASFDSGGPGRDEGRALQGATQKRAAFKQRASSLEDKTSYSQRVQSYQSKFAEELQRIKKLVGKPNLKKAYSTEQLSQKDRLTTGKLEPIPPQVVKKLEARERAMEERGESGRSQVSLQSKGLEGRSNNPEKDNMTQPDTRGKPADRSSLGSTVKTSVTMETVPVHQLPGQPLPTATRTSLSRFGEDPPF